MSVVAVNAVVQLTIADDVRRAMGAVELPEVQEMIRRLAEYGLGVCVAHQHTATMDFATLPADVVQVEENCRVRWVSREQAESMTDAVPVAWRWSVPAGGAAAAALCTKICKPNAKTGHQEKHFPINT